MSTSVKRWKHWLKHRGIHNGVRLTSAGLSIKSRSISPRSSAVVWGPLDPIHWMCLIRQTLMVEHLKGTHLTRLQITSKTSLTRGTGSPSPGLCAHPLVWSRSVSESRSQKQKSRKVGPRETRLATTGYLCNSERRLHPLASPFICVVVFIDPYCIYWGWTKKHERPVGKVQG